MRKSLHTVFAILAVNAAAFAGDLNPPVGPIAPTPGPEPRTPINATTTPGDADSLYKITAPGSYYLTGNVTGVAAKHGIEIAASGVTLDLNGFDLEGVPAMGDFDGVTDAGSTLFAISVLNGSVRNWGDAGVDLGAVTGCRVEDVRTTGNAGFGITIYGGVVSNCSARDNFDSGINGGLGSAISNCTANDNGNIGIASSYPAYARNGSVTGCTADGNQTGILGGIVTTCTVAYNSSNGISANTVTSCVASTNFNGIVAIGSVANCWAYANQMTGISLTGAGTVTNCTANGNLWDGIKSSAGGTVSGCTASLNGMDGIEVANDCLVIGNTCRSNAATLSNSAGIHATGSDNRIEGNNCPDNDIGIRVTSSDNRVEGNNCTNNDTGIQVGAAGNIIIRNSCSGNTVNWYIEAGNACQVINATLTTGFTGDSGGIALGPTNPHVNFTY